MTENIEIEPINHPLNARVFVPGSKSLTNRVLLISALADGPTNITNALFSDDSCYFAGALHDLGFQVRLDEAKREISITGCLGRIPADSASLFIGNAGTAARFLSAFLTLGKGGYILDGDARMRERPLGDLVTALAQLGAKIEPLAGKPGSQGNFISPPVKIIASGLPGGKTTVSGTISSQFLSALLMVAPYAMHPVEISVVNELNSKPYVDMTLAVMADFGINVIRRGYDYFKISPGVYTTAGNYTIESDASAASYFFAAPAILGGSVLVENISRESRQGDIAFVDVLKKMGCRITEGHDSIQISSPRSHQEFCGVDVDLSDIPDTAQTLAAIAPFASSPTIIRGIASARLKESDRVGATCKELSRLGVSLEEYPDGMKIYPCEKLTPSLVRTYNDHRMAMSFALIGLRVSGVKIENPGCVAKTFPNFFSTLETLR